MLENMKTECKNCGWDGLAGETWVSGDFNLCPECKSDKLVFKGTELELNEVTKSRTPKDLYEFCKATL